MRELNSGGPASSVGAPDGEIAASLGMLTAAGASLLLWGTIIAAAVSLF